MRSSVKKYRVDLKFYDYGRTSTCFSGIKTKCSDNENISVTDIYWNDGDRRSPYGYFIFIGTEPALEKILERVSNDGGVVKVIGVDWDELDLCEVIKGESNLLLTNCVISSKDYLAECFYEAG